MRLWFVAAVLVAVVCGVPAAGQAPDLDNMDLVLKSVPDGPVARVKGVSVSRGDFVRFYQMEVGAAMLATGRTSPWSPLVVSMAQTPSSCGSASGDVKVSRFG